MNILIVDPENAVAPHAEPLFRQRMWSFQVVTDRAAAIAMAAKEPPDVIVIHGDGVRGEAAHLCQRFKSNMLTSGIPLILVEDATPPAWLLAGMPADAVVQSPWEPDELLHHVEALVPVPTGSGMLDDLTNFPRRRSIMDDVARRMLARELFGVGVLSLREADAYRQDYGRTGLDQFVVLISVLLRRHAAGSNPVSVGYLEEGKFLIVGASSTVHEIVAQTSHDFDTLVPAYYEMDTLFGTAGDLEIGPTTWIGVDGCVCLIEPDRYDNLLQLGVVLSDTMVTGHEALMLASSHADEQFATGLAAD